MFNRRALVLAALAAMTLLAGSARLAGTPIASAAIVDISSAGPLTHIYIGSDLSCQVRHSGDSVNAMYPPGNTAGDCSTVVLVSGTTYGYSSFAGTDYTPVSQSAVTGAGTSGDPYQVVTVVDAGTTGIRVTETDSYVVGDEFYRTDVQVSNSGNSSVAVRIYRGADCYLGGSDEGYGFVDTVGKVVGCTEHPNNSPSGRVELWTPITPADHYYEAECCSGIETTIDNGDELPDTCICTTLEDNGAAIDWNRTIGAGQNTTVSHYTTFSPTGVGAPTPTPGGPTSTPGAETATPVRIKTHTPTATATAENTSTPLPATNTPVASPTVPPPPPTQPGGGAAGNIHAPDTGTGSTATSRDSFAWLLSAGALAVAGAGVVIVGRRARR